MGQHRSFCAGPTNTRWTRWSGLCTTCCVLSNAPSNRTESYQVVGAWKPHCRCFWRSLPQHSPPASSSPSRNLHRPSSSFPRHSRAMLPRIQRNLLPSCVRTITLRRRMPRRASSSGQGWNSTAAHCETTGAPACWSRP
eukprot:Lithocolla_globosa_v1_NODE_2567_length_1950_cov_17.572559.p5 type:complete len:139 gc:universal NODE_2567_length_1950_cov_17.572559:777-361(-)